ncbi:putative kinesin light chain [Fischerella sp. NIES-4106]|nr:putative kinesin light chain [Fischerella sp. NIES-4106]
MNFPPQLQQTIEKWATSQGISTEQFILQAITGDHRNVATSLNNLAELYRSQGGYSEAEPLYIDALAMTKRLFVGEATLY